MGDGASEDTAGPGASGDTLIVRRGATRWCRGEQLAGRAVIVDIDGVLSDASGRQHYLNNPQGIRDWEGFFGSVGGDPALVDTARLLELLDDELQIVLLSGRPAHVMDITVEWLERQGVRWDLLVLRDDDLLSHAAEYKREALSDLQAAGYDVRLAFDDDRRIVDMYRAAGIPCVYVHSGYYG